MDDADTTTIDDKRVTRAARCFGPGGRLARWPSRRADQLLVLWALWSFIPADRQMDEAEVNSVLRDWHDLEDYVLLRRELINLDLLRRTPDGRVYRRIAQTPPPEAQAMIDRVAAG